MERESFSAWRERVDGEIPRLLDEVERLRVENARHRNAVCDLLNAIAVVQQSYTDEDGEYVSSWAMELLGTAVGRSQDLLNASWATTGDDE